MLRHIDKQMHINTTSPKHKRQVVRLLERSGKVSNINIANGRIDYTKSGWIDDNEVSEDE